MKNSEIEKILIRSCQQAHAAGRQIVRGAFGNENSKHCCALTAFELIQFGADKMDTGMNASNYFNWNNNQEWAFINGFDNKDGEGVNNGYPAIYRLGQTVANKLIACGILKTD